MPNAIQSIVAAYVKLGDINALKRLKEHRQVLLRGLAHQTNYDHALTREYCERDIAEIELGLLNLLQEGEPR